MIGKPRFKNGEDYYHKIYLVFNATVAVSILPLGYLLLQKQAARLVSVIDNFWLEAVLVVALVGCIAALIYWSWQRYKIGLKNIKAEYNLRSILLSYYQVSVKKFFTMMIASILSVAGYYITLNGLFIVSYVVTMIFLSLKRPTLNLLIEELNLSDDQQKILIEKLEIE